MPAPANPSSNITPASDNFTPFVNSRKRPPPTGDEEATSILRLGELENTPALSVAECNELLNRLETANKTNSDKPIYTKTRDYVAMFARFKDSGTVTQVDAICAKLLEEFGFTFYEKAQVATLCCDTAEEARTLIPSIEGKISDDDLQAILDDISKLRDFS